MKKQNYLYLVILMLFSLVVQAGETRIAVASNFNLAMNAIAKAYHAQSKHRLIIVYGSTGKLFAQIRNGAPYDVFLAADDQHPRMLEVQEYARLGSRFTYAEGRLVLWSPVPGLVDNDGRVLEKGEFHRVAIANPRLAPYGVAAKHVLLTRGVWRDVREKLVFGENIAQTMHFVESGNADMGFIALSLLQAPGKEIPGSYWVIPQALYPHIQQQAVLLRPSTAAEDFLSFLKGKEARKIIQQYGYLIP